ncbi:MAG TPA: NAD(+)/NADH kinase [Candidatus Koribacter sp.]|jgi:NAD+ kinase
MTTKAIAILSKPSKPELSELIPQLTTWLEEHGREVLLDKQSASYVAGAPGVERSQVAARDPEFAIVLGGDGTLLSAARALAAANIPILAVNLGSLGFLTEVPLNDMYSTLEKVLACTCPTDERTMIACDLIRDGEVIHSYTSLNDVVVNKSAIARLVGFDLSIDGRQSFTLKADGVIVATPTGSTAYSLAAGGPVLMPAVQSFLLTPVCPHSLTHRPVVVPESAAISIVVRSNGEAAFLTIDGQVGQPLKDGDQVVCRKAAHAVKLLQTKQSFFQVLREKLKWGERE